MTTDEQAVVTRVLGWRALVEEDAERRQQLDPSLVLAVIAQESGGDPYAIRVERGFWRRYGQHYTIEAKGHALRWVQVPDVYSASYGLMQVMAPIAYAELGLDLRYPTELCDPAIGVAAGCRVLRRAFNAVGTGQLVREPVKDALLRYNGGADLDYPTKVMDWRDRLFAAIRQAA